MEDAMSILGLKEAFAAGETPDPNELRGRFVVRLVTGIGPDIRFFGHLKFFPDEVEESGGGFNRFWGGMRIGNFKINVQQSILGDGEEILKINYNRPGNPFFIRALNDELKKVGQGRFLGRGVFLVFGKAFNSFYFSLEKIR